MDQTAIFGPFLAMMTLTFVVWVFMYVKRIGWIQASGVTPTELAIPGRLAELTPPDVSNPSDNLKNLFEIPVLFYALCLYLYASATVDLFYVAGAWVYVAFRYFHSAVHCTVNIVMLRFWLYATSTLTFWIMALRAMYELIG